MITAASALDISLSNKKITSYNRLHNCINMGIARAAYQGECEAKISLCKGRITLSEVKSILGVLNKLGFTTEYYRACEHGIDLLNFKISW
jgi:hypothetical protein